MNEDNSENYFYIEWKKGLQDWNNEKNIIFYNSCPKNCSVKNSCISPFSDCILKKSLRETKK